MPSFAYLDASAIVKLVVAEIETGGLERDLANRSGLITSRLGAAELIRAASRAHSRRVLQQAEEVLESFVLVDVSTAVLNRAARLQPSTLRTLDAIHLATAGSLDLAPLDFVTYDDRLAAAAAAHGLRVKRPGQ